MVFCVTKLAKIFDTASKIVQNKELNLIKRLFLWFFAKLDEMAQNCLFRFLYDTSGLNGKRLEIEKKKPRKGARQGALGNEARLVGRLGVPRRQFRHA